MLQEAFELPLISFPQFSLMSLEQLWGLSRLLVHGCTLARQRIHAGLSVFAKAHTLSVDGECSFCLPTCVLFSSFSDHFLHEGHIHTALCSSFVRLLL